MPTHNLIILKAIALSTLIWGGAIFCFQFAQQKIAQGTVTEAAVTEKNQPSSFDTTTIARQSGDLDHIERPIILPWLRRAAQVFGGEVATGGYVQFVELILFWIGIFLLLTMIRDLAKDRGSLFAYQFLPRKAFRQLSEDEVRQVQMKAIQIQYSRPSLFLDLVIKVCTKYLATRSVSEALNVATFQLEHCQAKFDKQQSSVAHLGQAVVAVGMLGTIIGNVQALGLLNDMTPNMAELTSVMSIALDTTGLAIVMDQVLRWRARRLENNQSQYRTEMESAILEFINRIKT